MRAALTQMDIVWENKEANKEICRRLAEKAVKNRAELIIFPEMTLTGFTMNTEYAGENMLEGGETVEFFKGISKENNIAVIFGMVYGKKDKTAYNKQIMVYGDEILYDYSKIHPFSYGGEGEHYEKGQEIISTIFNGISMGGFVCYDLRFPEIFQISSKINKLITVIANWPADRTDHWHTLLKARAIENQAFIIGVNRVGRGGGLSYKHSSAAYNPYGEKITKSKDADLIFADIDVWKADRYRKEFPVKSDRREEIYREYYS